MKTIYAIVVTYNGIQWLHKCFGSLRNSDYPIKVIAVDNGSTDGTVEALSTTFPEVEIIKPGKNLGFGMGNTVGIKKALEYGADFVFLFNQDAYLFKGSMRDLLQSFDSDPMAGIISPIHLAGDERNLDFGFYRYVHPNDTPYLLGDLFSNDLRPLYQSKFINAAAWIMRTSMIKQIGFFHPIFDHYGEDVEYALRMEKVGFKFFVFTRYSIVHDRVQNRSLNKFFNYGQDFQRRMLLALVEKKLSYGQVTMKFIRLFFFNLLNFQPGNAVLIYKHWKMVNKKKKFLS
jgi:GT2 family glycosyltransferase